MTACKKLKRGKNITIEDLYRNKNFVPPKEQNLETIFEEPKQAKDGAPILTSHRKFKRYLDFDPITGKVNKPKKKRNLKKVKGRLRSTSKKVRNIDISVILETLNDLSDDCDMDLTVATSQTVNDSDMAEDSVNIKRVEDNTVNVDADHVTKNDLTMLPIVDKTVNLDADHLSKNNSTLLPVVDKTVNGGAEAINCVTDNSKSKALNADVLCKTCALEKKLCSCELATRQGKKRPQRKAKSGNLSVLGK